MIGSRSAAKRVLRGNLPLSIEARQYAFGEYRLDTGREILKCGNKIVPLPKRLFALLLALIEADGNVVSRENLASLLWPGGGMAGFNLSQHIYMLRQILGESARDRQFIMTVHGNGFRFAAPVSIVPAQSALLGPGSQGIAPADDNPLQSGYDAFACYSRASVLLERPTAAALGAAIEQFSAALTIDPGFAPALVGAARAYALLAQNSYVAGDCALPLAVEAIEQALTLSPASASAHAVHAGIALLARWDWNAAKRSIEIAMELGAEATVVRLNAACIYGSIGDYDRASAELQQALLLAPYSSSVQLLLGRLLVLTEQYEQAVEHLSNLLDIYPDFILARQTRAQAQIHLGRPQDAVADLLCVQCEPREDVASRLPLLCRAYADAGDGRKAEETYERLLAAARTDFVPHGNLAICAIGLEREAAALDHLRRAIAAREPVLLLMRLSPWFARARSSEFERALTGIELRSA